MNMDFAVIAAGQDLVAVKEQASYDVLPMSREGQIPRHGRGY